MVALAQGPASANLSVTLSAPTRELQPGKAVFIRATVANKGPGTATGFFIRVHVRDGLVRPRIVLAPPDSIQTTCPSTTTSATSTATASSSTTSETTTATTDTTSATSSTTTTTSDTSATTTDTSTTASSSSSTTTTTTTSTSTGPAVDCKTTWTRPACHIRGNLLSCRYKDLELAAPGGGTDSVTLLLKARTGQQRREHAVARVSPSGHPHLANQTSITIKVRPPY